ncbi:MAG: hypothetical protein HY541_07600 [Deltaproteobacteria bacterium]|nr:hypothetical protein [Deltaproteobacteria bacterium]
MQAKKFDIALTSFGYKYGIPRHADMVLDVRFLANPYYVERLRDKTGRSSAVQKYVLKQKACLRFIRQISTLLELMLKEYAKKGKHRLTVAFGCTGGKHRSVVIVEALKKRLQHPKINITVTHRDEKL